MEERNEQTFAVLLVGTKLVAGRTAALGGPFQIDALMTAAEVVLETFIHICNCNGIAVTKLDQGNYSVALGAR